MPRVVVVPARSPLADADRLTEADVSDSPWLPTALAHPGLEAWSGPATDGSHSRGALRNPAAIPGAVATTGRIALHAEAASRFYPHPDVRLIPLDGPPVQIAVATRATDDRHAITAVRHATWLLGRVGRIGQGRFTSVNNESSKTSARWSRRRMGRLPPGKAARAVLTVC
jgi:hypothetical protein